jgi:hypothetical protein
VLQFTRNLSKGSSNLDANQVLQFTRNLNHPRSTASL